MKIKNRLLEIRLKKGYKFQKDFAEFLGIGQYQYNRHEKNKIQPNLETTFMILKKLDIDFFELYYKDND
jgi:DNA-binding XRE family transcriptional regulator